VSQSRGDLKQKQKQKQKHLNALCVETGKSYDMRILNAALRRKFKSCFLGKVKLNFEINSANLLIVCDNKTYHSHTV
jgi:hypothetical protein